MSRLEVEHTRNQISMSRCVQQIQGREHRDIIDSASSIDSQECRSTRISKVDHKAPLIELKK